MCFCWFFCNISGFLLIYLLLFFKSFYICVFFMSKELEEKLRDQLNRWADWVGLKDPKLKEEKVNNILWEVIKRNHKDKDFIRGVIYILCLCNDEEDQWDYVFILFVSNYKILIICDYQNYYALFQGWLSVKQLFKDYEVFLAEFEADTPIIVLDSFKTKKKIR